MKVLKSIIMLVTLILIAAYGVKIYQRASDKTVNVHALFDVLWSKASKTVDQIESKVKNSSEALSSNIDEHVKHSKNFQSGNNDKNNDAEHKEKLYENHEAVAVNSTRNNIRKPQKQESMAEIKNIAKNDKADPRIDPIDEEDREVTEEVLSGLLKDNYNQSPAEPLPEPMSLKQAERISNIYHEVWEILQ